MKKKIIIITSIVVAVLALVLLTCVIINKTKKDSNLSINEENNNFNNSEEVVCDYEYSSNNNKFGLPSDCPIINLTANQILFKFLSNEPYAFNLIVSNNGTEIYSTQTENKVIEGINFVNLYKIDKFYVLDMATVPHQQGNYGTLMILNEENLSYEVLTAMNPSIDVENKTIKYEEWLEEYLGYTYIEPGIQYKKDIIYKINGISITRNES